LDDGVSKNGWRRGARFTRGMTEEKAIVLRSDAGVNVDMKVDVGRHAIMFRFGGC
jgi:hypothetical protein